MLTVGANLEAICDNLPARKVSEVQGIIVAHGATLKYLPPYSPDLYLIEQALANKNRYYTKRQNEYAKISGERQGVYLISISLMSAWISSITQGIF
jgi:transposase